MPKEQRRYHHERQPLLPWNAARRETNRRDALRETKHPQQLELFPLPQQRLFPDEEGQIARSATQQTMQKRFKMQKTARKRRKPVPSSSQPELDLD